MPDSLLGMLGILVNTLQNPFPNWYHLNAQSLDSNIFFGIIGQNRSSGEGIGFHRFN